MRHPWRQVRQVLAGLVAVAVVSGGLLLRPAVEDADARPTVTPQAAAPETQRPIGINRGSTDTDDLIVPWLAAGSRSRTPAASSPVDPSPSGVLPAPQTPSPTAPPPPTQMPAPTPAAAPTPAPVADPNPAIIKHQHVNGRFGQTLELGGYRVMLRPKTSETASQCWPEHGPGMFELAITFSTPFSGPDFSSGSQALRSCRDPGSAWLSSGTLYEIFLPLDSSHPISIAIYPNHMADILWFHFQ